MTGQKILGTKNRERLRNISAFSPDGLKEKPYQFNMRSAQVFERFNFLFCILTNLVSYACIISSKGKTFYFFSFTVPFI